MMLRFVCISLLSASVFGASLFPALSRYQVSSCDEITAAHAMTLWGTPERFLRLEEQLKSSIVGPDESLEDYHGIFYLAHTCLAPANEEVFSEDFPAHRLASMVVNLLLHRKFVPAGYFDWQWKVDVRYLSIYLRWLYTVASQHLELTVHAQSLAAHYSSVFEGSRITCLENVNIVQPIDADVVVRPSVALVVPADISRAAPFILTLEECGQRFWDNEATSIDLVISLANGDRTLEPYRSALRRNKSIPRSLRLLIVAR